MKHCFLEKIILLIVQRYNKKYKYANIFFISLNW